MTSSLGIFGRSRHPFDLRRPRRGGRPSPSSHRPCPQLPACDGRRRERMVLGAHPTWQVWVLGEQLLGAASVCIEAGADEPVEVGGVVNSAKAAQPLGDADVSCPDCSAQDREPRRQHRQRVQHRAALWPGGAAGRGRGAREARSAWASPSNARDPLLRPRRRPSSGQLGPWRWTQSSPRTRRHPPAPQLMVAVAVAASSKGRRCRSVRRGRRRRTPTRASVSRRSTSVTSQRW